MSNQTKRTDVKFTPGPWIAKGFGPNDSWLRVAQPDGWPGDPVCDVGNNLSNRNADAALICAAPDLYAALDALVERLVGSEFFGSDAVTQAIAALRKAATPADPSSGGAR